MLSKSVRLELLKQMVVTSVVFFMQDKLFSANLNFVYPLAIVIDLMYVMKKKIQKH